jgi:hypothetical protein
MPAPNVLKRHGVSDRHIGSAEWERCRELYPAYMDFYRDALKDRFQRYGHELPRAEWFMQFDVATRRPLAASFPAVLDAIGAVPLHTRRIFEWGDLLVTGGAVAPGTSFDRLQLTDTCIPVRPCTLNYSEEGGWVAPDGRRRDIKVRLDRHPKSGTVTVRLRSPVVSPRAGWVCSSPHVMHAP